MSKLHVGILTNVPDLNSVSGAEVDVIENRDMVKKALEELGHDVSLLNVTKKDLSDLKGFLDTKNVDLIFNLCDRLDDDTELYNNRLKLIGSFGIPYTGADPENVIKTDNKINSKMLLAKNGIPTPKFQIFDSWDEKIDDSLKFPLIVKPSQMHNGIGIDDDNVVDTEEKLREKIKKIVDNFKQPALVEEFIEGREFEVTIVGTKELTVFPIAELYFAKLGIVPKKIFSYESKWDLNSDAYGDYIIPKDIPKKTEDKIIEIVKKVYTSYGLKNYARIDLRLTSDNKPFVFEVTTNPCLSGVSSTKRAAKAAGIDYNELINRIVLDAFNNKKVNKAAIV